MIIPILSTRLLGSGQTGSFPKATQPVTDRDMAQTQVTGTPDPKCLTCLPHVSGLAHYVEKWTCGGTSGGILKNNILVNWCSHYGKLYGESSKKLKIELPYDPAISLLGI